MRSSATISSSKDLLEILVRRDHDGAGGNDLHETRDDAGVETGDAVDADDAGRRAPHGFRQTGSGAVDDKVGFAETNLSPRFEDVEGLRQDGGEESGSGAGEEVDFDDVGGRGGGG